MADNDLKLRETQDTKTRQRLIRPPLYKVLLLNDDYTTMDFVVFVLEKIFTKSPVEATQIMLQVHRRGMGLCGIYTKDIAKTKITAVHSLSRKQQFPLQCTMEKAC